MISAALTILDKLLNIVLHVYETSSNSNYVIQAAGDIYKLIYYNNNGEELPLVSSLLSYVPFHLKNAMPDDTEQENIATISLHCLTKIVLI